ncbi:sensor histidine kinase [Pedobacter frigoris]|nr:HAMP domain-containing sensor histidine kinase [Pedobacter frigoris]
MISIFFALELAYITITALFIIFLFVVTLSFTTENTQQIFLNISTSGILAFVLFTCSRYGYYFKSQHFLQLKELEERNEEIQNLNHQKGEILGFVAHDLRNPLNNIEALSALILTEENHPDATEVQLILNSAQHAKHIINDLIEVVQEKKTALKVQEVELIGFLRGIQNTWLTNTDRTRIIIFNTDQNTVSANINPSKFTRVIDNLIGNGIKFSPPNTPINIEVCTKPEKVQIRISDFGIGIPDTLKHLLFDQFSKAGRVGLNGEKSMGLGLHISKDIIEQHHGTLTVESQENKGTTFIISIPLAST